ncbi:hypothetical protein UlMin_024218 [Ulmus minor]
MAHSIDDAEFWLPSEFLDDEVLMGKANFDKNGAIGSGLKPFHAFPDEFPYEFGSFGSNSNSNSTLSSPVESGVSSGTDTESSDEEDFFAGLSRRFAQSTRLETQQLAGSRFNQEKPEFVLSGSPQSTLTGIGSWSGSPNGPSQVTSPPTTPFGAKNDTWDLIYAAAGEVARLKMSGEEPKLGQQGRGLLGPARSTNPSVRNPNNGLYSNQGLTQNLAQFQGRQEIAHKPNCPAAWGRQMKVGWSAQVQPQPQHHHHYQQQIQNRGRNTGFESGRCGRPLNLPQSAWPSLQGQNQNQQPHQNGTAMRAALLGGSGQKRECAGTGVFLPRRYNAPEPPRKKTAGCPNVLLPAKVVQALNLSFEEPNAISHPRFVNGVAPNHEALVARRNALLEQQRRSLRSEAVALNQEIRLPQEWTY